MKVLGKIFLLAAIPGCLPNGSPPTPTASSSSGADLPAAPCVWRADAEHRIGDCVVTDAVIAHAALALEPAGGGGVRDVEVLDATGAVLDAINYAYDPLARSLVFHATDATPRLLVLGARLTIRLRVVAEQSLVVEPNDCSGSTAELELYLSELASLGATCEVDDDCEVLDANANDACRNPGFAVKGVLTDERRQALERHLAAVSRTCAGAAGRVCETEYPRVASCDPETKECVGRF